MDVPETNIVGLKFYILGPDDIKRLSNVEIKNSILFQNDKPYPYGIHDAHLGTTDNSWNCETCCNEKLKCPGHCGHLVLKSRIFSPLFVPHIYNILKNVCYACSRYTAMKKDCPHCQKKQCKYEKSRTNPFLITSTVSTEAKRREYPHDIYRIFSKILPSDVEKLGYSSKFHPTHLLPNIIVVSPNSIRPDAKIATSNKHNSNDITILLQKVIDANTLIPMEITDKTVMTPELDEMLLNLNTAVSDMIKGASATAAAGKPHVVGRPLNAIMRLLQGKGGSIRKNIIAKRAWNQGRSIITCNTDLPLDTIGVPIYVARRIKKKVHVQDYNYKECHVYYTNGSKTYPGSTHIIRDGIKKCTDIINKTTPLRIGDILYRDIIDGDIVNFNRQPTLELSSITAIRLKVIRDSTIQMNVGICSYFNSDFDGDAMNLQFPHSQETEAEIENLSSVKENLINNKDTTIKASQVLDSKIGLADITNNKTRFSKYHFMNMCNVLPFVPQYEDKEWYSGYDLITSYLQTNKVFVNYTRFATINASLYKEFFKVDDADAKVVIEHGKMLSGILDNSSIGENVKYNLFHTIFNQYGYKHTIDAIYYLQQFALYYICTYKSYSISFKDFYINNECYEKIKESIAGPLDNSKVILKHALNKELIPPFGQTLNEYYENVQINNLETTDYVLKLLLSYITPDNNLFKAIVTGAKGKMFNLKNILAYVGTISLNGQRIKKNFSLERALPYYSRFDESPQARGFVTDSYSKGLSPLSFIKHLYDSRLSLILKALSTATAGTRQRKDMKSCESARITNNRVVMTDFNIIQPIYGGDGFVQTYNEEDHVRIFSADLSDAQFELDFNGRHAVTGVSKEELQHLDAEFNKLARIRAKYRSQYIESNKVDIPINIFKILKSFLIKSTGELPIIATINKINAFLRNLVYIYTNEIQEQQQTKMLSYFKHAIRPIKIYIRSYFNIATLRRHGVDSTILELTIQQIKFRLMRSLIIPGTPIGSRTTMYINQPLTQKILDSHHYSGLGSRVSARSFMDKFNEIFMCKDTSQMPTASMRIYFTDDVQTDYYYVKMAAFNMEMVLLKDIVSKYQILYEPYDAEDPVIKRFEKITGLASYNNLLDVCYKLYIDKSKIIIKNITVESIYMLLVKTFPMLHIVYNSRLENPFYFKLYIQKHADLKTLNLLQLKSILETEILSVLIKGVRNIYATSTQEEVRKFVAPDGRVESKNVYYIQTSGTNMEEMLSYEKVDVYRTYSDSIIEMYNMFGVISARNIIYKELYLNLENIDNKHYALYADLMTCTGECTSIDKNGAKKRHESLLSQITDSNPIQLITNAAMYRHYDEINSLSNAMLLSQVPHIGDNYNKFAVDLDAYDGVEDSILDDI